MRTDPSGRDYGFLRPWIVGAGVWGALSIVVLSEFKRTGDPQFLGEICLLLSLLWAEFGFAAIFNTLYTRRYDRLFAFTAVTVLPPLVICYLTVL